MNEREYIMLIGLPGSGKSTWLLKFFAGRPNQPYSILSSDYWIERWAKDDGITYDEAFKKYPSELLFAKLVGKQKFCIKKNFSMINDQTNLTRELRASKMAILPSNYKRIGVFFEPPPLEVLRIRHNAPERLAVGKSIPEDRLQEMIASLQVPSADEFDELIVVPYLT